MNYSNREQLREGDTIYAGKSFQLKRRIGNGGMGEVWLVEDLDIHVELAMKSPLLIFNENNNRSDLSDDRTTDYLIKELFYNEAKSLLLMGNYNNVVKCYYAHIINNHVHIFLEYVEGHNLTEYIELNKENNGKRDWGTDLTIAIQIANGMMSAHEENIIHRDLKPSNVLIPNENSKYKNNGIYALVTDFGLAKVISDIEGTISHKLSVHQLDMKDKNPGNLETNSTLSDCLTSETSSIKGGTYPYMSPEQWGIYPTVDKRTDIYSFGVLLFELITRGHRPYEYYYNGGTTSEDESIEEFYQNSFYQNRPINRIDNFCKDCPIELEKLILKCLEKDPKNRYQDFSLLISEIKKIYAKTINKIYPYLNVQRDFSLIDSFIRHIFRGLSFSNLNRPIEAIQEYDKAIEINNEYLVHNYKGTTLAKLGMHEKAIEEYDKAIEINPECYFMYANKAVAFEKLGKLDRAIEEYDKAIEIKNDFVEAYSNKGVVLVSLAKTNAAEPNKKKLLDALKQYDKAIAINPNIGFIHFNRASVLFDLERYIEAMKACDKAISLDPNNDYYMEFRKKGI